ncbi:MAG TPA: ABC transporter ATP-binding protein [Acidobacteriota bacterium]|nr:ABC transporter ATP-binding protein [Acidobacteriota bacterium]
MKLFDMLLASCDVAPFLEIKNLSHFYGSKPALQNVSLHAQKSEVLALLGPSGSGKSTLLGAIAGIIKPNEGKILLGGRNLLDLPPESRGLGMVFQDFALWPHMTVAQNVAFPLRVRSCGPTEVAMRTEKALARVGLAGFAGRRPQELSGGQQQRVALARAVVAETRLLLLDEPLSALDPATRASVRSELADILRNFDMTTIIVTHDREEAFELADRIAVLVDGKIQQHSKPEEAYEHPVNLIVARFIGANVLSLRANGDGSAELIDGAQRLELPRLVREGPVHMAIVPEQVRLTEEITGLKNVVRGHLVRCQYRGGEYRVRIRLGDPQHGQIVEARSKYAPKAENLFLQLPVEALHVIEESPTLETKTAESHSIANVECTQLKEKTA